MGYFLSCINSCLQGCWSEKSAQPLMKRDESLCLCKSSRDSLTFQLRFIRTWNLLLLLSCFSCEQLCATPQMAGHQAPCPWDCPGKNTGVGRHFLLQCVKVKSESEVAQSCPTLSDPMDYSLPGSSIHEIFQARVLEWGAIAFSIYWLWDLSYLHHFGPR